MLHNQNGEDYYPSPTGWKARHGFKVVSEFWCVVATTQILQ
jgi:hypothetical protein